MRDDLDGRCVLIAGGTRGIGLATGLAFGRLGACVTLTHRWGSASEDALRARFAEAGAPAPDIVEADVAYEPDMRALYARLRERHDHVEVYVPNVAFAPLVENATDYRRSGLLRGIEYSAWPFVEGTFAIAEVFGRLPRYVVGMSSTGPDALLARYDLAASAKSVLETLARYVSHRVSAEDCRVNVLRSGWARTESFDATFGTEFHAFAEQFPCAHRFVGCEEVADAVVALCSGLMDGVRGQVLTLDHGVGFSDNLMGLYAEFAARADPPPTQGDPR